MKPVLHLTHLGAVNYESVLNTCRKGGRNHGGKYGNNTHTDYNPYDTEETPQDGLWRSVTISKLRQ